MYVPWGFFWFLFSLYISEFRAGKFHTNTEADNRGGEQPWEDWTVAMLGLLTVCNPYLR